VADIALIEQTGFGLANIVTHGGAAFDIDGSWPVAPGQWLAYADVASPDWAERLADGLAGRATVIDQSSAYVLWLVIGTDAQRLLQKGLPVDLTTLVPGAAVVSVIAHIGVIVHCPAPNHYHLAVFRSFAHSFRDWLQAGVAALQEDTHA